MRINNDSWRGYGIALAATAVLLLPLLALRPVFGDAPPASLLLGAVMLAASTGGLWPGVFATALAVVATIQFLMEPLYSFELRGTGEQLRVLLLASAGVLLSAVVARARSRERRREQQLLEEIALRRQVELERHRLLDNERRVRAEAEAAKAELADALDLTESLFATAPVGLGLIDRDFRYIRVNAAMARLNRLPVADHIGRTVAETLFEAYAPERLVAVLRQVLDSGEPVLNLQLPGDDQEIFGVLRSFNVSYFPVRKGRDIVGIGAVVEETTEHRQAEDEIRQLNAALADRVAELEALFHLAPVGLLLAESRDCRHIRMNQAFADMLGMSLNGNASFAAPPEQRPAWRVFRGNRVLQPDELPIQRAAASARPVTEDELQFRRDDGEAIRASVQAAPLLDAKGVVRGAIGAVVDLTERLEMEENLRLHAAHLEMIDLRKDEFLATLAHELRTPLSTIRNAVGVLNRPDSSERNLMWARDIIDRQVNQLSHLVEDLLDGARIIQGKIRLERRPLPVASLIQWALDAAGPDLDARRLRVETRLPAADVMVDGDEVRLTQVLTNLLVNAAKFSREQASVQLSAEIHGAEVAIRIRDEGIGIPKDLLPVMFDLFTQGRRPEEKTEVGLGIGLSLVKRLVGMHGGRVEAHSDGEGKGSEFVVWLPIHRGAPEGQAAFATVPQSAAVASEPVGTAATLH